MPFKPEVSVQSPRVGEDWKELRHLEIKEERRRVEWGKIRIVFREQE